MTDTTAPDDFPTAVAELLGLVPLTDAEVTAVLDLARDVAHGTERRYAPLTTFLAGLALGSRGDAGARDEALRELADRITATIDGA